MFFLSNPTNAASAFDQVLDAFPALRRFGRSLLFAVNEEYARPDREVFAGDELAVFPSVSGGSEPDAETQGYGDTEMRRHGDAERQSGANTGPLAERVSPAATSDNTLADKKNYDFFELTTEPIDVGAVARRVVLPECGATVTLDGYAREWTKGKRTLHLVYEAYPSMALREMQPPRPGSPRSFRHLPHRNCSPHRKIRNRRDERGDIRQRASPPSCIRSLRMVDPGIETDCANLEERSL